MHGIQLKGEERGDKTLTLVLSQVFLLVEKCDIRLSVLLLQKRQRNSLIKDIDPFHQLHEERKGNEIIVNI